MNGMEWIDLVFGAGKEAWDLTAPQMAARAALIYAVALAIVRIGKKRFMGRATAFDVIVGIILGSIASRAVTGNAPMIPTMTATIVPTLERGSRSRSTITSRGSSAIGLSSH